MNNTEKPLYKRWKKMRQRCRENHSGYEHVVVCKEWDAFECFEAWATANGFSPELTIDRIDGSKGYAPDNCRWVDRKAQSRNRSATVLTAKDAGNIRWILNRRLVPKADLALLFNVSIQTISDIHTRHSWCDIEEKAPEVTSLLRRAKGNYHKRLISQSLEAAVETDPRYHP